MTNQNSSEKFLTASKSKMAEVEHQIECSVNLEGGEQVDKVLAVNVDCEKLVCESLTKEANASGIVVVDLIYLTTSGNILSTKYTSPFLYKVHDDKISPNSNVIVKCKNAKGEVSSINSSMAKLNCTLTFLGFVLNNEEVSFLNSVESDVCTKEEEISFTTMKNSENSTFTESVQIALKEPAKKVLLTSSEVFVKDYELGTNCVSITCELENEITYLTDEEVPQIKTVHQKSEVKQDVEISGAKQEQTAELDIFVQKNGIKTNIEEDNGDIKVSLEVPLDVYVRLFENQTKSVICDLYSTTRATEVSSTSYQNTTVCEPIIFDKKIEGSLIVDEEESPIDKLLAVNYSKAVVTNEYFDNGTYNISGVVQSNLIYYSEDDVKVNSLDIEIPFAISTQVDYDGEYLTDLDVKVCDVDVLVKRGRDVYVDATIKVRTKVCKTTFGAVISNLGYGDEYLEKDYAIEIYFAKTGEKVWDIAKKLNIPVEQIYTQNPDIKEVLENDEKLAIYYQKNN